MARTERWRSRAWTVAVRTPMLCWSPVDGDAAAGPSTLDRYQIVPM